MSETKAATADFHSQTERASQTPALKNRAQQRFADEVVADVKRDFAKRQQARRPYEIQWQLNMNFVMGNQYCTVSPRGEIEQQDKDYCWQEKQVFNHIAMIVDTRVSRLNRVRPRPIARPFSNSESDIDSAKLSTKILAAAREELHLDEAVTQATSWSEVCGTAFYKLSWDTSDENVQVTVCSPFEIYPDSNVTATVEECGSIIHAKAYSAAQVKDIWGVDIAGETIAVFAPNGETRENQVMVIERYTKPTTDYPRGKLEIVAGSKLLYYGDLPYRLGENGEFTYPFVRQISLYQPGCFWGGSVVERVIPIQRAYNAVKNRKHEFLNRFAMGVLTVEDGSVDTDDLEAEGLSPGKILVYRQGADKPALMDSGKLPDSFADEEEQLLKEFVSVSGVSEFARNSATPTTVTSGVALQLIAEQDDIRIAASVDSVKQAIKHIARFVLRMYRQFVSGERLMRFSDGQNTAEVFYFRASDVSCDDVVFETENELSDSPATRRTMLFDLLEAGVLADDEGKLSASVKAKVLSMMGFGNWDAAQDVAQLHIARAERENVDIDHAEVLSVDDHALHIETHTKHVVGCDIDMTDREYRDKIIAHIEAHKAALMKERAQFSYEHVTSRESE